MAQYTLYWLFKDIMISIACFSGADILDNFGISFIHLCVSIMYVGYVFVNFKWFYTVGQCLSYYTFYNYLKYAGMIVPFHAV